MESFVFPASWETEIRIERNALELANRQLAGVSRIDSATVPLQIQLMDLGLLAEFAVKCHGKPSVFAEFPWLAMYRLNAGG